MSFCSHGSYVRASTINHPTAGQRFTCIASTLPVNSPVPPLGIVTEGILAEGMHNLFEISAAFHGEYQSQRLLVEGCIDLKKIVHFTACA